MTKPLGSLTVCLNAPPPFDSKMPKRVPTKRVPGSGSTTARTSSVTPSAMP